MQASASMEEELLVKLTKITEANLADENFGVTELAREMGMSRTTLHRKLRLTIKKAGSQFISELRLKKAHLLLQQRTGTVSEIAYEVGFGSATYFSKCFHDFYGYTPGDVLKGNHVIQQHSESEKKKRKTNRAIYIVLVIIMAISIYLFSDIYSSEITIGVLFPENTGEVEDKSGKLEGFHESIQNKLSLINKFEIVSSSSMYSYRNSDYSFKKIAKKVGADYILQIRGKLTDENLRLHIKLIDPFTQRSRWDTVATVNMENEYDYSEKIAKSVARELKASITKKELTQIKKLPTTSKAARSHYEKGLAYNRLEQLDRNSENMYGALNEFKNAVHEDSTYGDPWLKLAGLYTDSWFVMPNIFLSGFLDLHDYNLALDTAQIMLDKAIKYGVSDQDELLMVQAKYNHAIGNIKESRKLNKQMWKNKKGGADYFMAMGGLYNNESDYYDAVKNWLKYLEMIPDNELTNVQVYRNLVTVLGYKTGFTNVAKDFVDTIYAQENNPSSRIMYMLPALGGDSKALNEYCTKEFNKTLIHPYVKASIINYLVHTELQIGNYDMAYLYLQKRDTIFAKNNFPYTPNPHFAWLYQNYGRETESQMHCNKILKNGIILTSDSVHLPYGREPRVYYQLAAIYSFKGQNDKAYECLKHLAKRKTIPLSTIKNLEHMPHFKTIRNESTFQKLLKTMKARHKEEYNRIISLLTENGYDPG